jgi:VCBS repeat protein
MKKICVLSAILDGRLDVISTGVETGSQDDFLSILLGNGDGTFQTPINYDLGQYGNQGWGNSTFGVADFNNDGKLDFAIGGISSSIVLLQR